MCICVYMYICNTIIYVNDNVIKKRINIVPYYR